MPSVDALSHVSETADGKTEPYRAASSAASCKVIRNNAARPRSTTPARMRTIKTMIRANSTRACPFLFFLFGVLAVLFFIINFYGSTGILDATVLAFDPVKLIVGRGTGAAEVKVCLIVTTIR